MGSTIRYNDLVIQHEFDNDCALYDDLGVIKLFMIAMVLKSFLC